MSIRWEKDHLGVVTLWLQRPDVRNALNSSTIVSLCGALESLRKEADCLALVIRGEGKVFCAGADLNYMKEQASQSPAQNLEDALKLGELFFQVASFPVPVICVVQGAAVGGGFGLTVCADFALLTSEARLGTSEVRLGIVPGVIGPYIVRRLGIGRASALMHSAELLTAAEAQQIGLAYSVCPAEEVEVSLRALLTSLLKGGPLAQRRTKELLLSLCPLPDLQIRQLSAQHIAEARQGAEGQEGLAAFLEKRLPAWQKKL